MFKKIIIDRFGQPKPLVLPNGDRYDSIAYIQSPDGKTLYKHQYVNTDFTTGYRGGILAEDQKIGGVCGKTEAGRKDIWLYHGGLLGTIDNRLDITPEQATLKSLIGNPNHGGLHTIQWVKIHWGGRERDGSHGCITLHPGHGQNFFDYFSVGDPCEVAVIRSAHNDAPPFYRGL